MRLLFVLILGTFAAPAMAGFVEVGASVNYRSSTYDDDNYMQSLSYTGSFAYYFWEMCAWELNYTTGYSKQVTKGSAALDEKIVIEDNIEMTSMDLVLSFAGRQEPFRPYVKLGAGYLTKERFRKVDDDARERISEQNGIVPSAGLGFAINLTKEFSIKLGLDAWTSPLDEEPVAVDYVGRAGISFIF